MKSLLAQNDASLSPASNAHLTVDRIAFGSCSHQRKKQPLLDTARVLSPDLFIYLGDNIYGDTRDMRVLEKKYRKLNRKGPFKRLRKSTIVLATWDDHDYGANDAGRHYPMKSESRDIFLDFWNEPSNSSRRQHEGIYHALHFGPAERRVQIILLDTRSFRDNLVRNRGPEAGRKNGFKNDYRPNTSPDSTFLGASQWNWLDSVFRLPAKIRIVASSNQFAHSYNGWESWTNVPYERDRMLETIRRTQAEGVLFLSGDVHWGELSKLERPGLYPIYDATSSGITQTWPTVEPNSNRIGPVVRKSNIGWLDIDWEAPEPSITVRIRDKNGVDQVEHRVLLSELQFER
jgi:alkaline phosphatase D